MGLGLLLVLLLVPILPTQAQPYPVVTVDYRELQLVPEDFSILSESVEAFRTDDLLISLLQENDTLFWEEIGSYDASLMFNVSLASYAIVQLNSTGFYQTIVALNSETLEVEWLDIIASTISANYSLAVRTATDFFADDGHYWGLCEEILLVPGSHVGLDIDAIWLFEFYLVGETERWTLMIDTDGVLQDFQFIDVPCQECVDYTPLVILAFSSSIIIVVLVGFFLKNRIS
ncbi:MAG: hypothetical protein ACFFDR_02460 [Candidatus Thorarchaeota archaeon]